MISVQDRCLWVRAAVNVATAGLLMFYLGGCSTAKPEAKPEDTAQSQQQKNDTASKPLASVSGQSSSLDQLKKGESVGTPLSSPLKDIYFDFDRADLRADAREILKANADWLKKYPAATVQIEGHCDERGTAEYNLALGAKRAQTAKDFLVTLGIPEQRLSTVSYGQELPVCTEHSEECWQKNRHDRFVAKNTPTT
jgi:peptidoglycan-associated lipoprotein